jgi:sigma-B regulation protein RsbU (phosphoserine phosphatase)
LVAEVLSTDACALMLAVGAEADGIEFRASVGWEPAAFAAERHRFGRQGPAGTAYFTGRPARSDDLESDQRFGDTDLYREAKFRSVLAVPVTHSGKVIGALVVNTRAPRHFGDDDVRLMQLMANQAAIAIETTRLQERAHAESQLRKELELARDIQASFLPQQLPRLPGWEFGAYYSAAREIGGDFYDFIPLRDPSQRPTGMPGTFLDGCNLLGLVIADVTDKGVPAALFMALSRTIVRAVTISGRAPAEAIRRANELIRSDSRSDQFISLFYGALDPDSGALRFVNAGHNPPMLVRADSVAIFTLHAPGIVLGILDSIRLTEAEVSIEPGDVLLAYTDGVTDALNPGREEFGAERLAQVLLDNRHASAEEVVRAVVQAVETFVEDAEPFDDMTLFAVKRVG